MTEESKRRRVSVSPVVERITCAIISGSIAPITWCVEPPFDSSDIYRRSLGPAYHGYRLAQDLEQTGMTARLLRGSKMRSLDGLMTEVSASFQFPLYFGHNWSALDDILSDTSWSQQLRFVLVVVEPEFVLTNEPPLELSRLVAVLGSPNPVATSEARSVYTILWFEKEPRECVMRRWIEAGAEGGLTPLM